MARPDAWTDGEKITHTKLNQYRTDMVSQTDTAAQTIKGDLDIDGDLTVTGSSPGGGSGGEATVSSGGTIAHGLGGTPAWVAITPKALQPYVCSYNADATNITVYHNKVGTLTVGWRAGL